MRRVPRLTRLGGIARSTGQRWLMGTGAAVLAVALVVGGILVYQAANQGKQVTAYFSQTIGVYPGSTVRILGVPVGTVDAVHPVGTGVRVTMTINQGIPVPADAKAAVIAPSVVSDRYVQLTPAYTSGPQIADGAVIPESRTAVPLEVDQVFASLNKLAADLGPLGVNKHGALSNLVRTGAANLSGNGQYLQNMIAQFSGLSRTLGNNSGNLFATISNLQRFTTMLKDNNGQVQLAENQLAQVSSFLAADRADLSASVNELATALTQVQGFIASNRGLLKSNVDKLAALTSVLVKERASLAEALDTIPLDVDNLVAAYNTSTHTLDGRGDLNELSIGPGAPGGGLTNAAAATGTSALDTGSAIPAGALPVTAGEVHLLPPLPLPSVGTVYGTPEALAAGGHR